MRSADQLPGGAARPRTGSGPTGTVPVGGFGGVKHMAGWICFMLSDSADFLCGSIVVVEGGTDAYFRADGWPKAVPAYRPLGYLRRFKS
jgi:hypothetical protein